MTLFYVYIQPACLEIQPNYLASAFTPRNVFEFGCQEKEPHAGVSFLYVRLACSFILIP